MLSKREKEILSKVLFSYKEIGKTFYIARSTINTHFNNIREKLKEKTNYRAFFKAIKDGEIKRIDLGFWDDKGQYHPDWYIVDLRKE